jgi:hypothetical protein
MHTSTVAKRDDKQPTVIGDLYDRISASSIWLFVVLEVPYLSSAIAGITNEGAPAADTRSCSLLDDALDLAAVDVKFPGDGSLAAARFVPGPYRLFQSWCGVQGRWRMLLQQWCSAAR